MMRNAPSATRPINATPPMVPPTMAPTGVLEPPPLEELLGVGTTVRVDVNGAVVDKLESELIRLDGFNVVVM